VPGFTEEDVKRYMRTILPDGRELLARRTDKYPKGSQISVFVLEHQGDGWRSLPAETRHAPDVESLFRASPELAAMEWEPLFENQKYG